MPTWSEAPELTAMAEPIIKEFHSELIGYPIRFLFRSPARKLRGSVKAGTAEIVSGRFAHFVMTPEEKGMLGQEDGPRMFWIEISEEDWSDMSPIQRKALLDHELCHCAIECDEDGEPFMSMRDHDIEEFEDIARRHGAWHDALWSFGEALLETGAQDHT